MSIKYHFFVYGVCAFMLGVFPLHAWHFNQFLCPQDGEQPLVTVMLIPAGDVRNHGRALQHQFEQMINGAWAASLKEALERTCGPIRVIVSHGQADKIQQTHSATMANTLDVDLVLSLNCYCEHGPKPELFVYQFSYGADYFNALTDLAWYGMSSAYLFAKNTTRLFADKLVDVLGQQCYADTFIVRGPYRMPFRALSGIKVPAVALELSLKQDDDWQAIIEPLVAACDPIVGMVRQKKLQGGSHE